MKVDDLVTPMQIRAITGVPTATLYRWWVRGHVRRVRADISAYQWSEIRPIIADRLGLPPDSWADIDIAKVETT